MKNTRCFWAGIGLLGSLVLACGGASRSTSYSDSDPDTYEDSSHSLALEEEIEEVKLPKLSNENVAKVLLEFGKKNPETLVKLKTRLGTMTIQLYEETPIHRANFIQLIKRGYYDGTVFHRVVKDLIIQGGNLDKPIIRTKKNQVGFYRVPAEMQPAQFFHKKGALASPRRDEENPEKRSNPYEFYIVQGSPLSAPVVQAIGQQNKLVYTPQQLQVYTTLGGLPHLDGKYTVFGEVIEGLEVIDKIAELRVDPSDNWPFDDVKIEMEIVRDTLQ